MRHKIFVVEDDREIAGLVALHLRDEGWAVRRKMTTERRRPPPTLGRGDSLRGFGVKLPPPLWGRAGERGRS